MLLLDSILKKSTASMFFVLNELQNVNKNVFQEKVIKLSELEQEKLKKATSSESYKQSLSLLRRCVNLAKKYAKARNDRNIKLYDLFYSLVIFAEKEQSEKDLKEFLSSVEIKSTDIDAAIEFVFDWQKCLMEVPSDMKKRENEALIKYKKNMSILKTLIGSNTLNTLCRNLSEIVSREKIKEVVGRNSELRDSIKYLNSEKPRIILVGLLDVGKTALVETLALKILKGEVSKNLQGRIVLSLSQINILKNKRLVGIMENQFFNFLESLDKNHEKIILFIDEIHNLMNLGSDVTKEGSPVLINYLKPFLDKTQVMIIGATTRQEYDTIIRKDRAFERRFLSYSINELSLQNMLKIRNKKARELEKKYNIKISPEAVQAALIYSWKFVPDQKFPKKATLLLSNAASSFKFPATNFTTNESAIEDLLIDNNSEQYKKEIKEQAAQLQNEVLEKFKEPKTVETNENNNLLEQLNFSKLSINLLTKENVAAILTKRLSYLISV